MLAAERRNEILEKLQEEKRVIVSELSQKYQVSEETIRRDLDKLEKDGYAVKSYGGATLNEDTNIDMPFNVRKKKNTGGKQKIAAIVEGLIRNGDRVMLDASTTSVFIAKALKQKERLTVVTHSIEILIELSDMGEWHIVSTGGSLKEGYMAFVGPKVVEDLQKYNVDKVVISCKGFDQDRGITDSVERFAEIKREMLRSAKETILAVDYSKFDRVAFSQISDANQVDTVVTDQKPDQKWLDYFEEKGITCLYPEE